MKIKKMFFLFGLCFFHPLLWSQVQYTPLSSSERHELSSGISLSPKSSKETLSSFFLKYSTYFPETEDFLPEPYHNILIPGLQAGINLFSREAGKKYALCETGTYPFSYYFGLKGKSSYFEYVQPFAEGGLARSFCYFNGFSKFKKAKTSLSQYLSYGLFVSFKILDSSSIYSMDQSYGINDFGLRGECLHYYSKSEKANSFNFCQFGLQLSF